ncbi:MAG TPA: hypothetical protein PK413_17240 [Thermoanaerobaculia bacterium]|nr:hypothetical protein [Thermoanaerobaculia bacterium]
MRVRIEPTRRRPGWSRRCGLLLALPFLLTPPAQALAPPGLELAFDTSALIARNLTPGGTVLFFGLAREAKEGGNVLVRREQELADDDADGKVVWDLGTPLSTRAVWALVDESTGAVVFANPDAEGPAPGLLFPSTGLYHDLAAGSALADERVEVEVLWLRPGVGAWKLSAADGDPSDLDGETNGFLSWAAGAGTPLAGGPAAPTSFATGDVVLVLDPLTMEGYGKVLTSAEVAQ